MPRTIGNAAHVDYHVPGQACVRIVADDPMLVSAAEQGCSKTGELPAALHEQVGQPALDRIILRIPLLGAQSDVSIPCRNRIGILANEAD